MDCGGDSIISCFEHSRPERVLKVGYILAYEMVYFSFGRMVYPVFLDRYIVFTGAVVLGRPDVANRSVQPDVKEFVLFPWNPEAKVRSIT